MKKIAAKNSVRPSKGMAEGGFGGNSAVFLRKIEASPATCLNTWKAGHHRKILFSLGEKEIRRAHNEKSKEYFSVVWRACRAVAGLASLLGVLLKESSNIVQKTPPICTFRKIVRSCLGMVFSSENPSIFEGKRKRPLGNAEVPVRSTEKMEFSEPIFFLSPLAKGIAIFSSPKAI